MPVVYSPIQQTQIDQSNYPQYGITKPNESEYSYFKVDFDPLKYCGGHRNMAKTDYLFVSTTGDLKDATFFGKVENYKYSFIGSGGGYESVNWIGSEEDITKFNVPDFRGVVGKPSLPYFFGVNEVYNPLRFFVERPKDEAKTATCFQSVKRFFTGSGTKRRRKNKRKSSNKKRKQRKTKRRRH
jgi:hypothetical protein